MYKRLTEEDVKGLRAGDMIYVSSIEDAPEIDPLCRRYVGYLDGFWFTFSGNSEVSVRWPYAFRKITRPNLWRGDPIILITNEGERRRRVFHGWHDSGGVIIGTTSCNSMFIGNSFYTGTYELPTIQELEDAGYPQDQIDHMIERWAQEV